MANGGTQVQPDFSQMTYQELKAYILANREDDEALAYLILNHTDPNAPRYPANSVEEVAKILNPYIEKLYPKKDAA
jgi:hypothetical protein